MARYLNFITDQMQTIVDNRANTLKIGVDVAGNQKLAQSVTVGLAGDLFGLVLPIHFMHGRFVIEIQTLSRNGKPSGDVLGRREVHAPIGLIDRVVWRFFELRALPGRSLSFASGKRFAFILMNSTDCGAIYQGPVGNSYARGEGFLGSYNPPAWFRFSEVNQTRLDLPFITVMKVR
jgi:hypothetical protein